MGRGVKLKIWFKKQLNQKMTRYFNSVKRFFLKADMHSGKIHYCLVSLMWMKIGSNDITAQVPGVS
jgi:hypothetical protein